MKHTKQKVAGVGATLLIIGAVAAASSDTDTKQATGPDPWDLGITTEAVEPVETVEGAPETVTTPAPAEPALSTEDEIYLDALDMGDIYYASDTAAVDLGQSVCVALDSGLDMYGAIDVIVTNGGYDHFDAGFIVGAAAGAYCPESL